MKHAMWHFILGSILCIKHKPSLTNFYSLLKEQSPSVVSVLILFVIVHTSGNLPYPFKLFLTLRPNVICFPKLRKNKIVMINLSRESHSTYEISHNLLSCLLKGMMGARSPHHNQSLNLIGYWTNKSSVALLFSLSIVSICEVGFG